MEPRGGRDVLAGGVPDERPRRRWPAWLAVLALVVGGLALARPDLSLLSHGSVPDRSDTARRADSDDRNLLRGVSWAARGDLVSDRDFVARAMDRVREERADVSRLYFAGRLSDGSRLVLAGTDVRRGVVATAVHALHQPVGVPLDGARISEASVLTDPQQVLAWAARGRDGSVRAVVLARPGPVRFELSARVDFDAADGRPTRRWLPVDAEDGVLVADLGPQADPIVSVRARGRGVFRLPQVVRVVPPESAGTPVVVDGLSDPGYRGPPLAQVSQALRAQAGDVVDLGAASIAVLWSGAPWKQRRLALLLLTRPDGLRFQALVGQHGEDGFPAGVRALAADAPNRLPWLLEPFSAAEPTLLLCPTGDGSVIFRKEGLPTRTLRIGGDGVVALVPPGPSPPSVSGADVTVLDPAGRILLRTELPPPGFDDPADGARKVLRGTADSA